MAALGWGLGLAAGGRTPVVSAGGGTFPQGARAVPASNAATSTVASTSQQAGIVDINTVLGYQGAKAAGTGMILTPSGEILTNNHVIDGATGITVTDISSGATYPAQVVGTDPSADVAVLQLQGASGLQTAKIGTSTGVHPGAAVTAVGNAGGRGTPIAATGSVLATGQTMTASNDNGSGAETLSNMIEIRAAVVPGDSGGPLYAANGTIIGMDTAASAGTGGGGSYARYGGPGFGEPGTGGAEGSGSTTAFAIPIDTATRIAATIESGHPTSGITFGYPAFLGVSLQNSPAGPAVVGVAQGTPAAAAGVMPGDVIGAVDGQPVSSARDLASIIAAHRPGDQLQLTWTDASGQSYTAPVTLATGPAN